MADVEILPRLTEYGDGLKLMEETHKKRANSLTEDHFFILEHEAVYTLGKHGGADNIIVKNNIPVFETERGGNVTYHGPGQIVLYPVINIKDIKIGIKEYIFRLEQIVINTLEEFGVSAQRNSLNNGVWVGNSKIASVGVRVRNGVTLHGIAVNINTDLEPFSWINPCGLTNIGVTSVKKETGSEADIEMVKNQFKEEVVKLFPECFNE